MTLIGNKLGSYEDTHDEKNKAEKALAKAKEKFSKKRLKPFQLDNKTWILTTSNARFERFKKAYNSKDRIIWE